MMRRQSCLCALTIPLLAMLSLVAPTSQAQDNLHLNNTHLEWPVHSVTQDGRVRVVITKQRPRLHLAKTYKPAIQLALEDDDTDYYDELLDLQVGYRRPELINQTADLELSDEIKLRLALARMKALEAYNQKWVNVV